MVMVMVMVMVMMMVMVMVAMRILITLVGRQRLGSALTTASARVSPAIVNLCRSQSFSVLFLLLSVIIMTIRASFLSLPLVSI